MEPSTQEEKHSVYGLTERVGIKTIQICDSKEWGGDFLKWWLASRLVHFNQIASCDITKQCFAQHTQVSTACRSTGVKQAYPTWQISARFILHFYRNKNLFNSVSVDRLRLAEITRTKNARQIYYLKSALDL